MKPIAIIVISVVCSVAVVLTILSLSPDTDFSESVGTALTYDCAKGWDENVLLGKEPRENLTEEEINKARDDFFKNGCISKVDEWKHRTQDETLDSHVSNSEIWQKYKDAEWNYNYQNSNQLEIPTQPESPKDTQIPQDVGILGSSHEHASILVRIFGDKFDFSAPAYQIKSSWIHFEGNDGTTIHKHATGVTLGYLFDSLGLDLDNQCYVFRDGRSFCTNEDYSLKFFINGKKVNSIRDYEIVEGDKILVSYGADTPEEIESQLLELEAQQLVK